MLDKVGRDWFYERLFPVFEQRPRSEWAPEFVTYPSTVDILCRREIGCFQAVCAACFIADRSYLQTDADELAVSLLTLLVSKDTAQEALNARFPLYRKTDPNTDLLNPAVSHAQVFNALLGQILPRFDNSRELLVFLTQLLALSTQATVAGVLDDQPAASQLWADYQLKEPIHQDCIDEIVSCWGTLYVIDSPQGIMVANPKGNASLLLFTRRLLARRMCEEHGLGPDHKICQVVHWKLWRELVTFRDEGLRSVLLDGNEYPIGTVLQMIEAATPGGLPPP
jgi:hypothetical protein